MRIEKEYSFPNLKATLFSWNNKFLLKFEQGGLEQTYKFSELDYSIEEIEELVSPQFLNNVNKIFKDMNNNLYSTTN